MAGFGLPTVYRLRGAAPDGAEDAHHAVFLPVAKRVRAIVNGRTAADSLDAGLLLESGNRPTYYFRRADVWADRLEPGAEPTCCPYKGMAQHWTMIVGDRRVENALVSYDAPPAELGRMKGWLAFAADKIDHWYEEDEEVFGHPRDPYHRVDVLASGRRVRVLFGGAVVAETRRGLFLFETGHPTRYYIPPEDVRAALLEPSPHSTVCPYKGRASYWSLRAGGRSAEDAVWSYLDPLPDCPRIRAHFCFYPERVDGIEVEGAPA